MIDLAGITGIPFLKKSRFTGSEHHMNYMLEKCSKEEETYLRATVWPGPNCYDKTPEDVKVMETFAVTEEGLLQAQEWMNGQSGRFNG